MGLPSIGNLLSVISNGTGQIRDSNRDMTGVTWCERHYRRWTAAYPDPCDEPEDAGCASDQRVKGPRNTKPQDGNHPAWESAWLPGVTEASHTFDWSCKGSFGSPFGQCESPSMSGDTIVFNDCKGTWCRFEHCFDHNSGTGVLGFRGRLVVLDSNEDPVLTETETKDFLNTNSTFITGEITNLTSWFSQNIDGAQHISYVTHVMDASVALDNTFWIGAASEIEGGGGSASSAGLSGGSLGGGASLN